MKSYVKQGIQPSLTVHHEVIDLHLCTVICTAYFRGFVVEVPGVPWHPQILADQLTLSQLGGADYAHQIILAHRFSDLPRTLYLYCKENE